MSALLNVLSKVWACAAEPESRVELSNGTDPGAAPQRIPGPVAVAAGAVLEHRAERAERFVPGARKGPHALRLVHAVAASPQAAEPAMRQKQPAPATLRVLEAAPARRTGLGHEFYRKYTEAMLRRYTKLSMEAGRVPSMLGQEMFRGRVTSYKVHGFDDVVIFVHDLGQCLKQLSPAQQHLLRRIACEQYTQGETAAMLGISLRTVIRRYTEAVDRLTAILLERKMLEPLAESQE